MNHTQTSEEWTAGNAGWSAIGADATSVVRLDMLSNLVKVDSGIRVVARTLIGGHIHLPDGILLKLIHKQLISKEMCQQNAEIWMCSLSLRFQSVPLIVYGGTFAAFSLIIHTGSSGHSTADKNPVFIFIRTFTRKIQISINSAVTFLGCKSSNQPSSLTLVESYYRGLGACLAYC